LRDGLGVGNAKLEGDSFLGKSKRFGRVLDAVVDLVGSKHGVVETTTTLGGTMSFESSRGVGGAGV
jgi:hypothetical protein